MIRGCSNVESIRDGYSLISPDRTNQNDSLNLLALWALSIWEPIPVGCYPCCGQCATKSGSDNAKSFEIDVTIGLFLYKPISDGFEVAFEIGTFSNSATTTCRNHT